MVKIMTKSLEIVKTELEWLEKKYKVNSEHKKNKYQDILRYKISYNRKKTELELAFIFMPIEQALTLQYQYTYKNKKDEDIVEKHSFADVLIDKEVPAISEADIVRLKDNIKYSIVENKIVGSLSPTTQAITYTEIIKRNIDSLLDYGTKLNDKKS